MIKEIKKKLKISGTIIYLSQYGSHLYGLNTENSDLDFRGVFIPTIDDLILHKDKDEINLELYIGKEETKVDVKLFSLQKFINLCTKADTNALDLLFSVISDCEKYNKDSYMNFIYEHRKYLINTERLENPITYAFKQATKYGIKGKRRSIMEEVLNFAKLLVPDVQYQVKDMVNEPNFSNYIDNEYVKIDTLDNKGKEEKYLYVCGVEHQFNLALDVFKDRLKEKINKEYFSPRTLAAKDGNDWKALSHAIRILLEVRELLDTKTIKFPLKDRQFLLDIKLGRISREEVDTYFNEELSEILNKVKENSLEWNYKEDFWNKIMKDWIKSEFTVI